MDFYREGFLNKAGKGIIQAHLHSWRPRYFVLDGLQLKYYKSKEILPENMLGCIDVAEMECVSVMKNEKHAFQITTTAKRTYYMSGRSNDEIQGWIRCLQMAKKKYLDKQKSSSDQEVLSMYDEVNLPAINPNPPSKPPRSLIVSGTNFLNPPKSPPPTTSTKSPTSPTAPPTILSAYQCVDLPSKKDESVKTTDEGNNEKLNVDPTYDSIDEKAAKEKKKSTAEVSDPAANLYDSVDTSAVKASPKKKKYRASDPLPQTSAVPPPLPARLPSMSGEVDEAILENKKLEGSSDTPKTASSDDENSKRKNNVIGLYSEIGIPASNAAVKVKTDLGSQAPQINGDTNTALYDEVKEPNSANISSSASENKEPQTASVLGLYDEVGAVILPSGSKAGSETEPQGNGFGVYDEVSTNDVEKKEEKIDLLAPDPTHVYAKPQKTNSMKKRPSKRKLLPGLMDVGEVDIDIEEDAAGGRETLERGMTKPYGDRFAIEDLREALVEFDSELNNNKNGQGLLEFDVNQSESAFEVLRIFLERYE